MTRATHEARTPSAARRASRKAPLFTPELVRTAAGWRICARRFESTWADGPGVDVLLPDPTAAGDRGSPGR